MELASKQKLNDGHRGRPGRRNSSVKRYDKTDWMQRATAALIPIPSSGMF